MRAAPVVSSAVAAAVLAATLLAALVAPGCGRSAVEVAYDAYVRKVEPLLDREGEIWKRRSQIAPARDDEEPDLPRYFGFIEKEALPFYRDFAREVEAVDPGHERLATAHEELRLFARTRVQFVEEQLRGQELHQAWTERDQLEEKAVAGEMAKAEYGKSLGEDVADPRFTELHAVVQGFERDYAPGLQQGRVELADVQEHIRRRVLPKLRELRSSRWGDDERSKLLLRAVVTAEEYFTDLVEQLPVLAAVLRNVGEAQRVGEESEEHLAKFREALDEVRRSM